MTTPDTIPAALHHETVRELREQVAVAKREVLRWRDKAQMAEMEIANAMTYLAQRDVLRAEMERLTRDVKNPRSWQYWRARAIEREALIAEMGKEINQLKAAATDGGGR